jgi:hypothetical protein
MSEISHLPWWAQLLIGLGMVGGGAVLGVLAQRFDACLLGIAALLLGIAGLAAVFTALF